MTVGCLYHPQNPNRLSRHHHTVNRRDGGAARLRPTRPRSSRPDEPSEKIPLRGVCGTAIHEVSAYEHAVVTSQGSAYSRFQRALTTGNLQLIAAVALPK